jgi:hypothetical protein
MQIQDIKNKNLKWWLGIISCLVLFLIIGIFSYEKMSFVWNGIKIQADIETRPDSSLVIVKGIAAKATQISLNGREIFINKNGNFSEPIVLLPGFSIITINARDKFGKIDEKKFEIVRGENTPAFAFSSDSSD